MKLALLADIHGNSDALEAVLRAANKEGVTKLLIAGDLVGYYYNADKVIEMLSSWDFKCVSGNHEKKFAEWLVGFDCETKFLKYGSCYAEAEKKLTKAQVEFLLGLPDTLEFSVENKRVLLCHGSPWSNDEYLYPDMKQDKKDELSKISADVIIYGHTHYPFIHKNNNKLFLNPGSVGQPRDRKPGACWALWDTETNQVSLKREPYDMSDLLDSIRNIDPDLKYLSNVLIRTE